MKNYIIFLLVFITINTGNAQGWQWQNPLPQGNPLNSIQFTDNNTGYAVGNCGTIIKTMNGGITWSSLLSGTPNRLLSVWFTDSNTGFVVGDSGVILKTLNAETIVGIYNLTGGQVKYSKFCDHNLMEMDVSTLPKGMYLVKLQTRSGVECRKLIIQ